MEDKIPVGSTFSSASNSRAKAKRIQAINEGNEQLIREILTLDRVKADILKLQSIVEKEKAIMRKAEKVAKTQMAWPKQDYKELVKGVHMAAQASTSKPKEKGIPVVESVEKGIPVVESVIDSISEPPIHNNYDWSWLDDDQK